MDHPENSIFRSITKLFKAKFWRHKKKIKPGKESSEGENQGPRRPRASDGEPPKPLKLSERQRPPRPDEDPYVLALTNEHTVYELWRLRRDQKGWLPSPELSFSVPGLEEQILAPAAAREEQPRLKAAVTASAVARVKAAVPKPTLQQLESNEELPSVDLDALPTVYISGDKLSAWLFIYPPVGEGQEVTQEMLAAALAQSGVSFGVNQAQLAGIPGMEGRYLHLFHAAAGRPPVPGKDGEIIDMYPRVLEHKLPVDEFDRVDFTAGFTTTQNVEKGTEICHISAPTPGVPGRTVTDKDIPTRDGVPATPPMGRNTAMSEDGTSLIATREGGLEFVGRAFQVNPMLDIAGNVDYSSGNVNFLGDVHIHGDVCSGFTVRAMGNIQVDGVVESATLEAGGDLVLSKGVQGNNQAVIRAHRDIYAKFLENCQVHVQENLHSECIIGCEVFSDAAVYAQSGRGTIIGGRIRASREVMANILGSKTEMRTSIYIGGLPCEDFEKEQITQQISEQELQLTAMEKQPNSPTKNSRMSKLRMQISVNRLKLNQYNKSLEDYQNNIATIPPGRINFGIAYPGTRLNINNARLKIAQETRHSMAALINGEVRLVT